MYLLDTNIFIRAFAGFEPELIFLSKAVSKGSLTLSVVNIAEFLARASQNDELNFNKITETFKILPVDHEIAVLAAKYRKQMGRKSEKNVLVDCFLAAQANVHNLTLVTNNKSDFPMKDIKIIKP